MRTEQRDAEKAREIDEANTSAARGHRASRFLKDDFWILDLEPALAKIQADAEAQKGWRPGTGKSLEDFALSSAYFSAVEHSVGEVLRRINLMIAAGAEAEEYLKKSSEDTK